MKKGQQLILGAILIVLLSVPFPFISACAKPAPPAALHEYIIPNYSDITGPYAELFRIILPSQNVVYGWWNENVGKKIGVKLVNKVYDTRYDAAETASIHARAVVSDKPIAILTGGAPMVLPIMGKVAEQKIVVIHGTCGVSFFHQPAGWVFSPLRDYATLSTASIEWLCEEYWKKPGKPRIVISIFEGVAGKDIAAPVLAWQKTYPEMEFVFGDILWHPPTPVELSGLARKIMEEGKPDYISFSGNAISTVAFYSAMRELGYLHKVPILTPPYLGLSVLAEMMGADMVEGDFEYNGVDYSLGTEAHKIFVKNIDKYGPGTPWGSAGSQYSFQVYMLTRAVERAVEKVGAANLTGQALYDELNEGEFKAAELYGLTGDIKFNPDDRLAGVDTVYNYQMKGGKVELLGKRSVSVISLPLKK
jgi:branched-chain amino acid transport system substrate-binding protein